MKKYKNKIKKILYKTIPCIVVFSLLFSFSLFPSAEIQNADNEFYLSELDDLFYAEDNGDFIYINDSINPFGFSSGYYESTTIPYGKYSLSGSFNSSFSFNPSSHYTIIVPLSVYYANINTVTSSISLFTRNGIEFQFSFLQGFNPDPLSPNNTTQTIFFQLKIDGEDLLNISRFQISFKGNSYKEQYTSFSFGLLKNRNIIITSVSSIDYDAIYGGFTQPIVPDAEDNIAHFESVEDDLLSSANVFGVLTFFENMENFELYTPLQASTQLFMELYNGGGLTTIFESIAIFSLALGLIVLLLAISPRLFSGGNKK